MRYASLTDRIRGTGADAWAVHDLAKRRRERGRRRDPAEHRRERHRHPAGDRRRRRSGRCATVTRATCRTAGLESLREAIARHVGPARRHRDRERARRLLPRRPDGAVRRLPVPPRHGRRGHRPRADLRDLRGGARIDGRAHRQRPAAARATVPSRAGRRRARRHVAHPGRAADVAAQPDGRRHDARRDRGGRRDLPPARPVARVRRGVRGSDVRRRARESALAVGHRRPRRLGLEPLQVALDDRLARRLGDRAGRARRAPDLPHHVHAVRSRRASSRTRRCYALTTQLDEVSELRELYRSRAAAMIDEFAQRRPAAAAHARGRDVPDARRPLDRA